MHKRDAIRESGIRVAILSGGRGTEREVSLVSGKSVAGAIEAMDIPCDLMDLQDNRLPMDQLDPDTHLVLPIIHGIYGEDGRLSAELEAHGFAYAGCDQASSALCFDKFASKAVAERLQIPVARDRLLHPEDPVSFDAVASELGIPFILKPRRDGSSVGLHLVRNAETFAAAQADLSAMDYLAEAYMEGQDLTVGLLDGRALGVVGIRAEGGLYDYRHKYTGGMSRYDVPAVIEESLQARLMEVSQRLFRALGCRDLARVDFRMNPQGDWIFLEINTLPGMTPTSLLPKTASCAGMDFTALVLEWTGFAFQRMQERRRA